MPRYEYIGRNKQGKAIKGIVDGANESTVALELIRGEITPTSITIYVEKQKSISKWMMLLQSEAPSVEDLTFFSRQMHSMLKAGVPIVRSVHIVLESAKNYRLKMALVDVLAALEGGKSLSFAMRHHPNIFPTLMIALVNVGENTGSLDQVFNQVAVHLQRESATKKQIKTAVRYPIAVLIVISLAIVVINIFVIPAFSNFFKQFKAALPLPTRILIGVSNFFVHQWPLLLCVIIAIIVGWITYLKTPLGRKNWDRLKLRLPLIGDVLKRALMARFARSFALSVRTGVPLLESIAMIARTTDNLYVAEQIMTMRTYIEHGESLTISATKSGMFMPLVLQMLSIGEETGEVDRLLDEVADYYEQEVDYDVKRLGDSIEPILIVFIAGMVLILALGIFLPMWDIWKVGAGK